MTIDEIKQKLTIGEVLSHYGLRPDKNGMLKCPFHDDKKASLKVYLETNTVYCFAGSCVTKGKSLDVIDFIMFKEGCTKHEAILKAKAMITPVSKAEKSNFNTHVGSLKRSSRAKAYCEERCLDIEKIAVGYKGNQTGDRWGRDCIIFPLKNAANEVVSLYGRSVNGGGHYYQSARSGLYPGYPDTKTKTLILCESIIDTASLSGLDLGLENYALLSLYGTNGLGSEHILAIKQCTQLEEIIFALDGDAAGKVATITHFKSLEKKLPHLGFSTLILPDNEDVNSLIMNHEDKAGLFGRLIGDRESLKAVKTKKPAVFKKQSTKKMDVALKKSVLDTSHEHNLIYQTALAKYYVKGGVRCAEKDLGNLIITLVVQNKEGKRSRNKLDLYEDKQLEKISRYVGEKLAIRPDLLELDIQSLTDELENYREQKRKASKEADKPKIQLNTQQKDEIINFWRRPNLIQRIDKMLEDLGLIGQENNRKLGFCIVSSYKMPKPLHGIIQGSSGSGKTHLLKLLCSLIPPEDYISLTRATDNSFYNFGPYDLRHKLISIEDKDALSDEANLAFRELQTNEELSLSTTGQDKDGNNRAFIKKVFGPCGTLCATTKGELYLDDMNRCFLIAVDESAAQEKRVLDFQKREAAGLTNKGRISEIQVFMQNAIRLLKAYEVVIPYATKINLPSDVKDKKRLNSMYINLVKQITLLHQFQRQKDSKGRLIATLEDLEIANEIMFDAIVLKADDLGHGPLRSFYEKLKAYLTKVAGEKAKNYAFKQREIRQALHESRTGVGNHIRQLMELEYIKISGGSAYRGFTYKISFWDDNEAIRTKIKSFLANQIDTLRGKSDQQ